MAPGKHRHALNRGNMTRDQDRRHALRSLLKAEEEFRRGEMLPLTALDEIDSELDGELR